MEPRTFPEDVRTDGESARLSDYVARLDTGQDMTVGGLIDIFATETFGAAILIFAAPNLVPNPPGTSPILGLPLLFLSCQLLLGRETVWLPDWLRRRRVSNQLLGSMARRLGPFLARLEHILVPRFTAVARSRLAIRFIGLVSLPMAVILLVPLPFLHMLPGAAMVCFGLGLVERDGLAIITGHVLALATLLMIAAIAFLAHGGLQSLLGSAT